MLDCLLGRADSKRECFVLRFDDEVVWCLARIAKAVAVVSE